MGSMSGCFEVVDDFYRAAAHATGCRIEISIGAGYFEVRNNSALGMAVLSLPATYVYIITYIRRRRVRPSC